MRQAKVSWEGPGTPMVLELSPLLAGQLALMMETPEIVAAVKEHPKAYAGVVELHSGICEAIGDYGRRYWADPNTELFPMKELPSHFPDHIDRDGIGHYSEGRQHYARGIAAVPRSAHGYLVK